MQRHLSEMSACIANFEIMVLQLQSEVCVPDPRAQNPESVLVKENARLRAELEVTTKDLEGGRHGKSEEFWESVMLQVMEATDRELDRELGLVSGRAVPSVKEGLDYSQFQDGISTLEDIKRALPQLQEELLKRRRHIDLLKMTDKDKTARLVQLEEGLNACWIKLDAHPQPKWTNFCIRLLGRSHRAWERTELKDDVERNKAGERVAAEMFASSDCRIDELGTALAEQTSQKLKLMATKEAEAGIILRDKMVFLTEHIAVLTKEKEMWETEASSLQSSLK